MTVPGRVVVVGAGVMGAWTAESLRRRGADVVLLDLYGPGNSLASSGDESRVIRVAHGPDEFYARWVLAAWDEWRRLERDAAVPLLHEVGTLWMAHDANGFEAAALETLTRLGVAVERLERDEIARRWPIIDAGEVLFGVFEHRAGALMARRAVAATVERFVRAGGEFRIGRALPPATDGGEGLATLRLSDGSSERADAFVFACGPWLPFVFPELLRGVIRVTRQEVIYLAPPPGDARFVAGPMPVWVDYDGAFYGIPSIEGRGCKLAPDWLGEEVDPDHFDRRLSDERIAATRRFLRGRFPLLADAPVVEGRVCQYESTADGHFLITRHPALSNAWIVGGGSGHGYKHGPMIGAYVAALVTGDDAALRDLAP
ncbi:MAG: FAD-dependent oxidoreductase, partial [Chloroflexota bacterium]|nr:FAD-dependent oxidoreductase [Chloroflexota bacterium]